MISTKLPQMPKCRKLKADKLNYFRNSGEMRKLPKIAKIPKMDENSKITKNRQISQNGRKRKLPKIAKLPIQEFTAKQTTDDSQHDKNENFEKQTKKPSVYGKQANLRKSDFRKKIRPARSEGRKRLSNSPIFRIDNRATDSWEKVIYIIMHRQQSD